MDMRIRPAVVGGSTSAPPSKSYSHRAILASGLADGARVKDALVSADTRATMRAVTAFGGSVTESEHLEITGCSGEPKVPDQVIDCANSGTTMRLVTGASGLVDGTTVLTGDASLRDRPQGPLLEALTALGGKARSTRGNGQAPLVIDGPIQGGSVAMRGDVSSQYISALLIAGACTQDGISIELTTELKSAPYVEITREVLDAFGIDTRKTDDGFAVTGDQSYDRADPYVVPGDFSSISYLVAAGVVASESGVVISGAVPSAQGDTAIVDIVQRMGGDVSWDQATGEITATKSRLEGIEVDVGDTPDLLPTIAALGAIGDGETRIVNCEHVRYKEADRVAAMATELASMGAAVEEEQDTLTIDGSASSLQGTTVNTYDDHRIVMALAVAGLVADGETTIRGAEHVDVSFPSFFDVLETLGADVTPLTD